MAGNLSGLREVDQIYATRGEGGTLTGKEARNG